MLKTILHTFIHMAPHVYLMCLTIILCTCNNTERNGSGLNPLPQSATEFKKKGDRSLYTENLDSAAIYYGFAANLSQNDDATIEEKKAGADALNNLGYLQFQYSANYLSSYESLTKALEIADQINYQEIYPAIYLNIANLFSGYDDQRSATEYLRKALTSAVKNKDSGIAITSLSNLIFDAIVLQDEMPSREILLFNKLKINENEEMGVYIYHLINAADYFRKGNYALALNELRQSKASVNRKRDNESARYACDFLIAKALLSQGENNEAISSLLDSFPSNNSIDPDWKIRSFRLISDTYATMNMPDSALFYHRLSSQLKDSIFRRQPYGYIKDIQTKTIVNRHKKKIQTLNKSLTQTKERLFEAAIIIFIIVCLSTVLIIQNRRLRNSNRALYLCSQDNLRKEELERSMQPPTDINKNSLKYKNSSLDNDQKKELIAKIRQIFTSSEECFSPDFTLERLAELINCRPAHASQVISECMHTNFRSLVAEARVNESCRRICDEKTYSSVTIESIAQSVGFRSRTNFIAVFKRYTGLTPTEYRRQHRKTDKTL